MKKIPLLYPHAAQLFEIKLSSRQSRKSRKICHRSITIGMDLGGKTSRCCGIDESGEVLFEQSVATTKKGMAEFFGGLPRCRIALEVGTHSPWVGRLPTSLGHEVIVANARQVKLISVSTRKDDQLDARTLVEARSGLVNAARGLAKALGERLPKCSTDSLDVEHLPSAAGARCSRCYSHYWKKWLR